MNSLKIVAIAAETVVLGAVAVIGYGLLAPAGPPSPVVLGTLAACLGVEAMRLPLAMRIPSLGAIGRIVALTLALCASALTFEVLALGVQEVLDARALPATQAEELVAEATERLTATKASADRLAGEVEAARKHREEIGREHVDLAAAPAVSIYRDRHGAVRAAGTTAANAAAAGNARAQEDHNARLKAAEADLATARSAAAAGPSVADAERGLAEAKAAAERARLVSPLHRLTAALWRTEGDLPAGAYATVRGVVTMSVAGALALGTLLAGLVSTLPERGTSRIGRAVRALFGAWRKRLRRIEPTIRTEYRDRIVRLHIPTHPVTGMPLDKRAAGE
jgi:hypothetical protein